MLDFHFRLVLKEGFCSTCILANWIFLKIAFSLNSQKKISTKSKIWNGQSFFFFHSTYTAETFSFTHADLLSSDLIVDVGQRDEVAQSIREAVSWVDPQVVDPNHRATVDCGEVVCQHTHCERSASRLTETCHLNIVFNDPKHSRLLGHSLSIHSLPKKWIPPHWKISTEHRLQWSQTQ